MEQMDVNDKEQFPENSFDDSNRDICLMDQSLLEYWPSLANQADLKFLEVL